MSIVIHTSRDGNRIGIYIYLEENLAEKILTGCPDPEEVYCSVNRGKERTVQPASTLRDEFGNLKLRRSM